MFNNYKSLLQGFFYKVLSQNNPDFAKFIHDEGYKLEGEKTFKHTVISDLFYERKMGFRGKSDFEIKEGDTAYLHISFSVNEIGENFIKGLFQSKEDRLGKMFFMIENIQSISQPVFQKTMQYELLSPVFLKRGRQEIVDGKKNDFIHPCSRNRKFQKNFYEEYEYYLIENIKSKIKSLVLHDKIENTEGFLENEINFQLNKYYGSRNERAKFMEKESTIITHYYDFTVTAPIEVHEVLYKSGLGMLNTLGLGMVEVKNI
ncbi:CRISPR-associated endoribonuclease Cas6 [Flammeovirga aprica]|uniref:CRISPR-associated endoribonuclease Cas6 n=1 Tax=Flammeovirga aprica JL-4 TaxID=694437 RepID=A0A7X9P0U1_9BACT|nr:CRISPR-associated endoribonuclease Cas6 [Flammeovirga aprica]NME67360.1 CRISPR-associated endoribonuclease Cas6 [Flammeovirga aprica JL-4]